jgi:hypothetical protein
MDSPLEIPESLSLKDPEWRRLVDMLKEMLTSSDRLRPQAAGEDIAKTKRKGSLVCFETQLCKVG